MKVEIWSDFVCPFCYIGKRRFESALARFPHKDRVEVVYRSFELDPHTQRGRAVEVFAMLAHKYGMSLAQARATTEQVTRQAQSVGLTYRFERMNTANTFDAHRLAHFAAALGKGPEMTERLLKAYFTDTLPIEDPRVLTELAAEVGLDETEAAAVLEGDRFANEVRRDEREAGALGIRGVPYFSWNRKFAVSGAQSAEVFQQAFARAWEEERLTAAPPEEEAAAAGGFCADGVCEPDPAPKS